MPKKKQPVAVQKKARRKEVANIALGREDRLLQKELLALAKSGAPRPRRGTRLGDALIRFTTPPATDE